jgi:hypothetical protein
MNKNYIFKISKILLFILFCFIILSMLQQYFSEGFRGRRGRGGGRGRRRIPASGRGGRPGRYLNRFRRRNNFGRRRRPWGPTWFQAYPIYDYYYNYFPTIYSCKEGCSPDGNCVSPGNGPNDCVWATDCWGC